MCDLTALGSFIVAAEIAALAALVFIGIAVVTSGNPWTSGSSPGLMTGAFVATLVAVASLGFALTFLTSCSNFCSVETGNLLAAIAALMVSLLVASVAILGAIVPSVIPIAGSVLCVIALIALLAEASLIATLYVLFDALRACMRIARFRLGLLPDLLLGMSFVFGILYVFVGAAIGKPRRS